FASHSTGPAEPEDSVGDEEPGSPEAPPKQPGPGRREHRWCSRRPRLHGSQYMRGLEGDANGTQAEAGANPGQHPADHGMQMKVLVGIAMIERQARGLESSELCSDLIGKLASRLSAAGNQGPDGGHVGTERAMLIHEMTHGGRWKNRTAFHEHDVQSDAQRG